MLSAVARVLAPGQAARVRQRAAATSTGRWAPGRAGGGRRRAPAARQRPRRSRTRSTRGSYGADEAFQVVAAIADRATSPRFTDYAGSAQAVMAIDTLLNALVREGRVTVGAAAGIRAAINRAYAAVESPRELQPRRIPRRAGPGRAQHRGAAVRPARADRRALTIALLLWPRAVAAAVRAAARAAAATRGAPTPAPATAPSRGLRRAGAGGADGRRGPADHRAGGGRGAGARRRPAVIAVTDRVGNVLGVFNMNGAPVKMLISRLTATGVLNDLDVDAAGASRSPPTSARSPRR